MMNAAELAKWYEENPGKGAPHSIGWTDEVYSVREKVWNETGLGEDGGCLCIGCLEKRIGRKLKPKDFKRGHAFNAMPASERLLKRQKRSQKDLDELAARFREQG